MIGVAGKPNQTRQNLLDEIFSKFDISCDGYLSVDDLKAVYNTASHPKIISGEMTFDQVWASFLANFDQGEDDDKLLRLQWNEYYSAVSASIENDQNFINLLEEVWRMY